MGARSSTLRISPSFRLQICSNPSLYEAVLFRWAGSEQLLSYHPKFGLNLCVEVIPVRMYLEVTLSHAVTYSCTSDCAILRGPVVSGKHGELHGCLVVQYPYEVLHPIPVIESPVMAAWHKVGS